LKGNKDEHGRGKHKKGKEKRNEIRGEKNVKDSGYFMKEMFHVFPDILSGGDYCEGKSTTTTEEDEGEN